MNNHNLDMQILEIIYRIQNLLNMINKIYYCQITKIYHKNIIFNYSQTN